MIIKTGKGDCIASGTVGRVEFKKIQTKSGGEFSILEFGLAYDYDKNAEQGQKTSYVNCKVLGEYADKVKNIVNKEKYIICGKIRTETYFNKDGDEKEKEVFEVDTILPNISLFLGADEIIENETKKSKSTANFEVVDDGGVLPF